ncbi:MAG: helix-turn-helix transcriptional regulator [Acidimicrobiales bacterium]
MSEATGRILVTRTYLEGCLLLLLAESPGHGYELAERLAEFGLDTIDNGAVYRALRSLAGEGLVECRWEISDRGPTRRPYCINGEGVESLRSRAGAIEDSSRMLSAFTARLRWLEPAGAKARERRTA